MKMLMMFHSSPNRPPANLGPAKRSFPFFEEMLKRHDVTVLTFGSPNEEREFRKHFNSVCKSITFVNNARPRYMNFFRRAYSLLIGKSMFYTLYSRRMQKELDKLLKKETFDLLYCSTPLLGFHTLPKNIPLVTDTHNVEYDILHRGYMESTSLIGKVICYIEYRLGKPQELRNCRKFDVITTTTDRDRSVFLENLPEKDITVIQNGIDPIFFEELSPEKEPNTLVFIGMMEYFPNDVGIRFFLNDILPLIRSRIPDVKLYIVGKNPSKSVQGYAADKIIVTGFVDDVRPYIARSQVFIVPLNVGGGIRGKALEAMAMGMPIVTTTIGCEGILLKDGESVLVADSPEEFAQAVIRLLQTPELRTKLGRNARATAEKEYQWSDKGRQLDEVCQSVITKHSTTSYTHYKPDQE